MSYAWLTPISRNTLILTPNQRLASTTLQDLLINQQQPFTGKILSLHDWLMDLWLQGQTKNLLPKQQLLSVHQSLMIWQSIINQSNHGAHLQNPIAAAELALNAWNLQHEWKLPDIKAEENHHSIDIKVFQEWAQQFKSQCSKHAWITEAEITPIISQHLESFTLPFQNIALLAFNEFTPQQQLLLKQLKSITTIHNVDNAQESGDVSIIPCNNNQKEILLMAQWAKYQLDHHNNQRIACVVPNLQAQRNDIETVFHEVFGDMPVNISGGMSFSEFAPINIALRIIQLTNNPIEIDKVGLLLRSPFIGTETESIQRAKLDAALREANYAEASLSQIISFTTHEDNQSCVCPDFTKQLDALMSVITEQPETAAPSAWASHFSVLLESLNWQIPIEQSEILERWQLLLTEFADYDKFYLSIAHQQALELLTSLADSILFQPTSEHSNIQVLGLLEASGLMVDQLWMMGCHDKAWPRPPAPNPFIPLSLQREQQCPHADPNREWQFAKRLTQDFICSAKNIIFSYPELEEDQLCQISPLLRGYPRLSNDKINQWQTPSRIEQLIDSIPMETLIDDQAPAINENEKISGGTAIVKSQAACPFKAFAEVRLQARGIAEPEVGLTPSIRGSLLHAALEYFWKEIRDKQGLRYIIFNDGLADMIDQAIAFAFKDTWPESMSQPSPEILSIEHERLQALLTRWLQLENERDNFSVIACEQWQRFSLHGITLHMKIDRIDRTQDKYVVIDYKTGQCDVNDWFGDRFIEPQLPLYAISSAIEISGLLFAQVNTRTMKLKGVTDHADLITNIPALSELDNDDCADNWSAQLVFWKQQLSQLLLDFKQGEARVDPKDLQLTCRYCECHALCRIKEKALAHGGTSP